MVMARMVMVGSYLTTLRIAKILLPIGNIFFLLKVTIRKAQGALSVFGLKTKISNRQWHVGFSICGVVD
jgi:hypothetical protein